MLLRLGRVKLSASPECEGINARRRQIKMKKVSAFLMALAMGATLSVGVAAQQGNSNNRPPKEDQKVKERDKTPPSNSNSNRRHP